MKILMASKSVLSLKGSFLPINGFMGLMVWVNQNLYLLKLTAIFQTPKLIEHVNLKNTHCALRIDTLRIDKKNPPPHYYGRGHPKNRLHLIYQPLVAKALMTPL
ncbi:MAG: hypothetical protein R2778_13965 [Saprospiraceae bacterium]